MLKFIKKNFLLLLILSLGLFLRVFALDWVPARLTVDEMSIGYNAFSILETGKDEWGRSFPLVFEAFGDFKLPAYIYATAPFIYALGLNILSIKIVSILSGMIFIWSIYALSHELVRKKSFSLLAAFLAATSPWTVHLSRQALESNLALAFFSVGLVYFLKSMREKKPYQPILAGVMISLSFYSYVAYRLYGVLLVLALIGYFKAKKYRPQLSSFLISLLLTTLPLIPVLFGNSGVARAKHVSLFADKGVVSAVNENRSFCFLVHPKLAKPCAGLFHKPQEFSEKLASNYMSFVGVDFLFFSGDNNLYLNNPEYGQLFLFLFPFYFWGLATLYSKRKNSLHSLMLLLFLLAPIPGALTGEGQMVRSSMMLPFLIFIVTFGLHEGLASLQKFGKTKMIFLPAGLLIAYFVVQYYVSYFAIYPTNYDSAAYQLPNQVATYLNETEDDFSLVYINDVFSDAHMYLAFYLQMDPTWYREQVTRPKPDPFGFSHPTSLGKYAFGADSFEEIFCSNLDKEGVYITDQSYKGFTEETYRNFSGVHIQVKIITFSGMKEYLQIAPAKERAKIRCVSEVLDNS